MGIAKLYSQSGSGGKINSIIEDYYAYAGENISAGDFVEFINGVAGQTTETSVDTQLSTVTQEGFCMSAVELSDNKVFIAHCYGENYILYGTVVTVSGTTITAGTDTRINATANAGRVISAVALDENRVFIAHNYTSSCLYSTICTISGTTITVASTQALNSTTNTANCISTELLSNGNVFIAHCYGGNYHLYGMVVTINGTTITTNTDTELSSVSYSGYSISTELLPNGNVFIAHNYSASFYLYGMVATINGTTITKGTDTSLSTTAYAGRVISTALLPTGKIFVAHSTVSNVFYLYGIVCTVSGTSISKGTDTQLSTEQYVGQAISVEALPSGKVVIFHSYGNTENYLYGMVTSISNTTITAKTDTKLNGLEYSGYTISTTSLKNGAIFVAHSNSNSYYLNAQIFGVNETTNRPTNNVTITEYETQVRKATTSDIYGVAKTSGMGAYKVIEYTIPEGESVNAGETREYSVEGDLTQGDIISKNWTEVTPTEYVAEDGTKLTASSRSTNAILSYVCDNSDITVFAFETSTGSDWVQLEFVNPVTITKMKLHLNFSDMFVTTCKIQGSVDGLEWVDLYDLLHGLPQQNTLVEINLTTVMKAKYYRIYAVNPDISQPGIGEWQVSEYIGKKLISGTALQSGTAGDTIQIAIPVTDEESTGHNDIVSIYTIE